MMTGSELYELTARIRRNQPRNVDTLALCDAVEALWREVGAASRDVPAPGQEIQQGKQSGSHKRREAKMKG